MVLFLLFFLVFFEKLFNFFATSESEITFVTPLKFEKGEFDIMVGGSSQDYIKSTIKF